MTELQLSTNDGLNGICIHLNKEILQGFRKYSWIIIVCWKSSLQEAPNLYRESQCCVYYFAGSTAPSFKVQMVKPTITVV